ncbi:hypothetical protein MLD38_016873 [Melastoma candidum]|uniref:Uncharacterized protein n=1 Tax=Melastoma candidum TaxID=119954 RepID=A0ACB9QSA2_9MYRT|nr:hypothetical protein MLD38_016873 [Melastoma candidum]
MLTLCGDFGGHTRCSGVPSYDKSNGVGQKSWDIGLHTCNGKTKCCKTGEIPRVRCLHLCPVPRQLSWIAKSSWLLSLHRLKLCLLLRDCVVTFLFTGGSQWTGDYVMELRDLTNSSPEDENDRALALASMIQKALQLHDTVPHSLAKGTTAKSLAEYFAAQSSRGLDVTVRVLRQRHLRWDVVVGRLGATMRSTC